MRLFRWTVFAMLLLGMGAGSAVQMDTQQVTLTLGGDQRSFAYISNLLTRILEREGYEVTIEYVGDMPMTRLERMLEQGAISLLMLGETDARNQRLTPIYVGMTNNLVGQRILFIPPGKQAEYDAIETLSDFQASGLVAGMGEGWGDTRIWANNRLPVQAVSGEWRLLYRMVASGTRGIDYLPRGAHEIVHEWQDHPELVVEDSLVLVYEKDHILYVSPSNPEFYRWLKPIVERAYNDGLIRNIANESYPAVFQPPINLQHRRVILLNLT